MILEIDGFKALFLELRCDLLTLTLLVLLARDPQSSEHQPTFS